MYVSPYSLSGYGFTAEWAARLQPKPTDAPYVPSPTPFGPPLRPQPVSAQAPPSSAAAASSETPPATRVDDIAKQLDADVPAAPKAADPAAPPKTPGPAARAAVAGRLAGTPTERPDWSPISESTTPARK